MTTTTRIAATAPVQGTERMITLDHAGARLEGNSMAAPNVLGFAETTLKTISSPVLALGYVAGLCLLFQRAHGLRRSFAAFRSRS